ncbi:MAG TPA: PEP-CTERM sorting domain-containing protein [Bryobacteraceae bacterium]|nr:PEP-CTERM sorting domain-containing protein [Bryobacteraceae bacterium]HPT28347.1 PEP-CTERM sorting domain-containing protein [Bryobacteraceae bacterium]
MRLSLKFVLALAMLAVIGTASAATLDFIFLTETGSAGSAGNVRTFTNGAVTVTVTSYSLWQGSSTALFESAATGQWDYGLGVDNGYESSDPPYQHSVDNATGYTDFLLLEFSSPVTPQLLAVYQFFDSDFDYWTGNIASSLTGLQLSSLSAFAMGSSNATAPQGYRFADLSSQGAVSALLLAADLSGSDDIFKVAGLRVDYSPPPPEVPEPASYATMGGALLGLGLFAARRQHRSR